MRAIGYRFESPSSKAGAHDYNHVQHIVELKNYASKFVLPTPEWIPQVYPAIPLNADSPAELLVAMIVALYGRDALNQLNGDRALRSLLTSGDHPILQRFAIASRG